MKIFALMTLALSLGACANLGSYVENPTIAAETLAVNNDLLQLKNDITAHAPAATLAADSTRLATDSAALDAAIKAAG